MPKIKKPSFFAQATTANKFSKLLPVACAAIFAGIGVIYILATHAAPITVTIQGTKYGSWYKDSVKLLIEYGQACNTQTKTVVPISLQATHSYYVWQDSAGNPYSSVDLGAPTQIPNTAYCNPNANYSELWKASISIDAEAPNVYFASTNSTTQSGSVTVTGADNDANSGVASVKVNGVAATLSGGGFTATVPLSVGSNTLIATATDVVGHAAASAPITITRTVPPPAPVSTPSPSSGTPSTPSKPSTPSSSKSSSSSSKSSSGLATTTNPQSSADSTSSETPITDTTDQSIDNSDNSDIAASSQPNVKAGQTSTLTSYDNLVKVTFPAGTFDVDAFCTVDPADGKNVPAKTSNLVGPYDIFCSDDNGQVLEKTKKDITVSITVNPSKGKYLAYANDNSQWANTASQASGKTLSFKLAKAESFTAATKQGGSHATLIINVIGATLLILFIGGGIMAVRHRRGQYANYDTSP